jgi:hypothetical protein
MVYQYYVVEVIRNKSKEYEHNVFWLYDEDDTKARLKGESKYHEILATAAVSEHPEHSAILFSSKGLPLMFQCYEHEEDEK